MPLPAHPLPTPSLPQEAEPKLPNLLKLLVWAQRKLDDKALYPRIDNPVTAQLVEPPPAAND